MNLAPLLLLPSVVCRRARFPRHRPGSFSGTCAPQRISLGLPPSLHHLRRRRVCTRSLVRRLPRYYAAVRLPAPWLIVVRPWASRCALRNAFQQPQKDAGSPGSRARCFRACAGSVTARGPMLPRQSGSTGVAFGLSPQPRHPGRPAAFATGHGLRGSIPGPHVPLSTLRPRPHERARMTRGRRSWLDLQRMTLSFTTSRRF